MTRKRLPKAIRLTSADPVLAVVGTAAADKIAATPSALALEAAEPNWAPDVSPALPANDTFGPRSAELGKLAAKRRVLAARIVDQNATLAAVSALAPVPVFNVAGVASIIVRMLKQLSELYQVQFERDRTRLFVIGVLGGAAPTGLGAAAVSTIGLVAPAPAFLGVLVSTLAAASVTRAIGEVFVESFERQAPLS
jgi:uncharacterized protein (DUF697 family)